MAEDSRILIVEDDEDTRLNLRDILELDGFVIDLAANGQAAREALRSHAYVITLLDRTLPDCTADRLLPQLREISPATEYVVVTGFVDLDSALVALRHGAADYILKPINPDALRSTVRRIIERRQFALRLQREHEFSDLILRTAEALVVVLDLAGCVLRFNPYFEKVTGWTLEEAAGKDWFALFVPVAERERLRARFLRLEPRSHARTDSHDVLTKAGGKRHVRWSISTLLDESGHKHAVLAVGLDITELMEAQERALQAERLATIGQTMTALAHESRNALQRIQASTEMLELELGKNEVVANDIRSISKAVKDLHSLLEEVRLFAAPVHLMRNVGLLSSVWRRAWSHLRIGEGAVAPRRASLEERGMEEEIPVAMDELRMEQVFRNLFENAIAASEGEARIEIDLRVLKREAMLEIHVRDHGSGIPGDVAARIFEPFYTTKPTGTGLGMAIVLRIVEAHGGRIWVDADQSQGGHLVLRLPCPLVVERDGSNRGQG